jgi:hypothetical protein
MVWEALNAETLEYPAESSVETQDSYDAVLTSRKETEVLSPFPKDERNDWVTMDRDLLLFSIVERRWRAKLWRLFEGERERCWKRLGDDMEALTEIGMVREDDV